MIQILIPSFILGLFLQGCSEPTSNPEKSKTKPENSGNDGPTPAPLVTITPPPASSSPPNQGLFSYFRDLISPKPKAPQPSAAPSEICPQGEKLPIDQPSFKKGNPSGQDVAKLREYLQTTGGAVSLDDRILITKLRGIFDAPETELSHLQNIAGLMKDPKNAGRRFIIMAFTATDGGTVTNRALSWKRAQVFEMLLVSLGVDQARLESFGLGGACNVKPETGTAAEISAAKDTNRRVEIYVR